MAYIDQRTSKNQRAAVMIAAAAIQGGAIVALVNGLAVHFIDQPPIPNPTATDIPVMPLPTPTALPPPHHTDVQRHIDNPRHETIVPTGSMTDTFPTPTSTPLTTSIPQILIKPMPTPSPSFTPRLATPRNAPGGWATPSDYPARDLREGNQGVTRFRLTVGADGRVQDCTVTASSGFPGLDRATCDNVSRRARFEPATDGEGNRAAGSYSGSIRWRIPQD